MTSEKIETPGYKIQAYRKEASEEFEKFKGFKIGYTKVNVMSYGYFHDIILARTLISDHNSLLVDKTLTELSNLILD